MFILAHVMLHGEAHVMLHGEAHVMLHGEAHSIWICLPTGQSIVNDSIIIALKQSEIIWLGAN